MEKSIEPKYITIANYIKDQIRTGNFRIGELLPGQRIIADILAVSRESVKRAVEVLEKQGIVECNPSKGSIVKRSPTEKLLIGYLVSDLQDPFHSELVRELDTVLHEHHGGLIAAQGKDDSRLLGMGITHAVKHHTFYDPGREDRVPTAYIGGVPAKANQIVSDIRVGMTQIYQHLKGYGHKNLAYASQFIEQEDPQLVHLLGAAAEDNIEILQQNRFVVDPLDRESCGQVIGAIRSSNNPPTALICYNDWLAIALMKAAREQGLDIPADLSMTGYDDLYVSSLLQVPLTTVSFSRKEAAEKVVKMLLSSNPEKPETEIMDTRIIIRESTGTPAN